MNIYEDIAERTNGDVYIGVVGPVRTGKSTFITRFMQKTVLPEVADKNVKKRMTDELPQSADGKTIMTTEPKFVPNEAVRLTFENKITLNLRMIDCVGYVVDGAEGQDEDGKQRLVNTPWSAEPMPFDKAAETGTYKVVSEHSTVAVVVTTDGSVTGLPRQNYVSAEERVIGELQSIGKPFVVVLNTKTPNSDGVRELSESLSAKYGTAVVPMSVAEAEKKDFEDLLQTVLGEFPVRRIAVDMPKWMRTLPKDNSVIADILEKVRLGSSIQKMCEAEKVIEGFSGEPTDVEQPQITAVDMGKGTINVEIKPKNSLFYKMLSEEAQTEIADEFALINYVTQSSYAKRRFDELKNALDEADATGYGVVEPKISGVTLGEPEMIKQGNLYGVKIMATAPSYHIIKVDVNSQISPIVGSEEQSNYLLDGFKANPQNILQTNMFGKTISDIAEGDLNEKCGAMSPELREKLTKTVNRIVNENKGGLICFLL